MTFRHSCIIMSGTNIRNTIELLADILHENGISKIKAESFRLAKFDKPDAVCVN